MFCHFLQIQRLPWFQHSVALSQNRGFLMLKIGQKKIQTGQIETDCANLTLKLNIWSLLNNPIPDFGFDQARENRSNFHQPFGRNLSRFKNPFKENPFSGYRCNRAKCLVKEKYPLYHWSLQWRWNPWSAIKTFLMSDFVPTQRADTLIIF